MLDKILYCPYTTAPITLGFSRKTSAHAGTFKVPPPQKTQTLKRPKNRMNSLYLHHFPRSLSLVLFVALSALGTDAYADIGPSFSLHESAWSSTDIVVATEGTTIDGELTVQKVWKGTLKRGTKISIPELQQFASPDKRTVSSGFGAPQNNPKILEGKTMVLFLKRQASTTGQTPAIQWRAASVYRRMFVSMVWLEPNTGNTFAYQQLMNPGGTFLTALQIDANQLETKTRTMVQNQQKLQTIAALPSTSSRASQAALLTLATPYRAREKAFAILGTCHKDAIPILQQMLSAPAHAHQAGKIIDTMAIADGQNLGGFFTKLLGEELQYWRAVGPGLSVGWWNGKGLKQTKVNALRNRYSRALHALYQLKEHPYPQSASTVLAFLNFWRSLPQLEDKNGLTQMSQAASDVLRTLKQ